MDVIARRKNFADSFLGSALNRLIIWTAVLLVVATVGFAVYYYVDRSGASHQSGEVERQLALDEQVVRDDPNNITNRLVLADAYLSLERFDDAVTQYEAAITINEKSVLGHVGLGRARFGTGDFSGATESFQWVIDLSKQEDISGELVQASYYYLGSIALEQKDPEEAIKQLTEALNLERTDSDAWLLMGTAHLQAGKPDEAISDLKKAVLFVPDFTAAYEKMALAYDQKTDVGGALYARGMVAYSKGKLDDAADKLQDAVVASPSLAEAFAGLGLVRELKGQREEAIGAYQEAIRLNPEDFIARGGINRLNGGSGPGLPANHPGSETGSTGEDTTGQEVTP